MDHHSFWSALLLIFLFAGMSESQTVSTSTFISSVRWATIQYRLQTLPDQNFSVVFTTLTAVDVPQIFNTSASVAPLFGDLAFDFGDRTRQPFKNATCTITSYSALLDVAVLRCDFTHKYGNSSFVNSTARLVASWSGCCRATGANSSGGGLPIRVSTQVSFSSNATYGIVVGAAPVVDLNLSPGNMSATIIPLYADPLLQTVNWRLASSLESVNSSLQSLPTMPSLSVDSNGKVRVSSLANLTHGSSYSIQLAAEGQGRISTSDFRFRVSFLGFCDADSGIAYGSRCIANSMCGNGRCKELLPPAFTSPTPKHGSKQVVSLNSSFSLNITVQTQSYPEYMVSSLELAFWGTPPTMNLTSWANATNATYAFSLPNATKDMAGSYITCFMAVISLNHFLLDPIMIQSTPRCFEIAIIPNPTFAKTNVVAPIEQPTTLGLTFSGLGLSGTDGYQIINGTIAKCNGANTSKIYRFNASMISQNASNGYTNVNSSAIRITLNAGSWTVCYNVSGNRWLTLPTKLVIDALPTAQGWSLVVNMIVIAVCARICSFIAHWIGLPRILGDVVAAFLLGQDVMGDAAFDSWCPPANRPVLRVLGYLGLMMAAMSAGSSFDYRLVRRQYPKVFAYSVLNTVIPGILALPFYAFLPDDDSFRGPDYDPVTYVLFLVCVLASSALPFAFLILEELKITDEFARFSIAVSCLSTVLLFSIVSATISLADNDPPGVGIAFRLGLLILLIVCLRVGQSLWSRAIRRYGPTSWPAKTTTDMCVLIVTMCFGVGTICDRLGESFVLGAFLMGVFLPFGGNLRTEFVKHVKWIGRWYFLPLFFFNIGIGFNTRDIYAKAVPHLVFIVLYGFLAKFILVPITHYLLRIPWREAYFYTSLANCRGFNVMVVASLAQDTGQFGEMMYLGCVALSIVSSALAGPLALHYHTKMKADSGYGAVALQDDDEQPKEPPAPIPTITTTSPAESAKKDDGKTAPSAPPAASKPASSTTTSAATADFPVLTPNLVQKTAEATSKFRAFTNAVTWAEVKSVLRGDDDDDCGLLDLRTGLVLGKEEETLNAGTPVLVVIADVMRKLRAVPLQENGAFTGRAAVDLLMNAYQYPLRGIAISICEHLIRKKLILPEKKGVREFADSERVYYVLGVYLAHSAAFK